MNPDPVGSEPKPDSNTFVIESHRARDKTPQNVLCFVNRAQFGLFKNLGTGQPRLHAA